MLIVPGTGILGEFRDRPLGMPLALFGWCLAAKLCGARIAFVSVGAGPIEHPLSRWLIKSAAAMAQYRSYRDTSSKKFMESIGFDTRNDAVYPDLAFKLPAPRIAAPARHRGRTHYRRCRRHDLSWAGAMTATEAPRFTRPISRRSRTSCFGSWIGAIRSAS